LQPTVALSTVLVAQHSKLISAQSVRTQPSIAAAIHAANGMLVNHSRPQQQLTNILDRLDLCSDNPHHFHVTRRSRLSPAESIVFNTVILGSRSVFLAAIDCTSNHLRLSQFVHASHPKRLPRRSLPTQYSVDLSSASADKLFMRDSFADHIADALLDAYAASKLAESDLAYVEEHLLVCEACRARLVATETFARAQLRAALWRTPISRAAEEVHHRSAATRARRARR
jgi:Putative zinc-finger